MARTKDPTKELKDQRIPVMLTESELKAIDDWSFANRIRSRGEAIRRLCQNALLLDSRRNELFSAVKSAHNVASVAAIEAMREQRAGVTNPLAGHVLEANLASLTAWNVVADLVNEASVPPSAIRQPGDKEREEKVREELTDALAEAIGKLK